jgi:hypothetical protein
VDISRAAAARTNTGEVRAPCTTALVPRFTSNLTPDRSIVEGFRFGLLVFFSDHMKLTQKLSFKLWAQGEGGGEELRLQSREGQELSTAAAACQFILKMSSEDQTVDPT